MTCRACIEVDKADARVLAHAAVCILPRGFDQVGQWHAWRKNIDRSAGEVVAAFGSPATGSTQRVVGFLGSVTRYEAKGFAFDTGSSAAARHPLSTFRRAMFVFSAVWPVMRGLLD